jgi:hypothetical protein
MLGTLDRAGLFKGAVCRTGVGEGVAYLEHYALHTSQMDTLQHCCGQYDDMLSEVCVVALPPEVLLNAID